jgi:hypothetical protein
MVGGGLEGIDVRPTFGATYDCSLRLGFGREGIDVRHALGATCDVDMERYALLLGDVASSSLLKLGLHSPLLLCPGSPLLPMLRWWVQKVEWMLGTMNLCGKGLQIFKAQQDG